MEYEYIADDDRVGSMVSKYPPLVSDGRNDIFFFPFAKNKKKADHIITILVAHAHSAVGYDRFGGGLR
jgi:hypothetical protein